MPPLTHDEALRRIRLITSLFIVGLAVSGITAFPLRHELSWLAAILHIDPATDPTGYAGLRHWIAFVWQGLRDTDARYPFLAYGTDWLAFGHLVIALFFLPAWREPARYRANFVCGLWACAGVFPLALLCGPLRGIPLYWRLIDCSFGLFGSLPLFYVLRLIDRLEKPEPRA